MKVLVLKIADHKPRLPWVCPEAIHEGMTASDLSQAFFWWSTRQGQDYWEKIFREYMIFREYNGMWGTLHSHPVLPALPPEIVDEITVEASYFMMIKD